MIIGSHCSMSAPKYVLGAVEEMLSYGGNALMIYTGPPQNTLRKPVGSLKVLEAKALLKEHQIPIEQMVIHAPYIINLANCVNVNTYTLAVEFLRKEIDRVMEIGAKYLILHPGSFTTATLEDGINKIIEGLNSVLKEEDDIILCLETMAGKGSEIGTDFKQLRYIMNNVVYSEKLGVCLDTCHIHDAGMDLTDFDTILKDFDDTIGLEHLRVIHVNDSKNSCGAKKDRHENIGKGQIGFETLCSIVHHPLLEDKIKILETPWIDKKAPYKEEIIMLKHKRLIPSKVNL